MAGHFRTVPAAACKAFPGLPQFSDYMKPNRFEGEVNNIEIIGEILSEIDGTFYRVMPDPQSLPFIENDLVSRRSAYNKESTMLIASKSGSTGAKAPAMG
jgi:hypothetical protein